MLLFSIAGNPREKKDRWDRAEAALNAMTAEDTLSCGLVADYCEVCLSFIRTFDVSAHDPARTLPEKREFIHVLTVLFLEGHILAELPPDARAQACSGGEIPAKTLTQIAVEQLQPMRTFYYGSKTKVLWARGANERCREALRRLQDCVRVCIARLDADLYERDILNRLECFDLAQWNAACDAVRGDPRGGPGGRGEGSRFGPAEAIAPRG